MPDKQYNTRRIACDTCGLPQRVGELAPGEAARCARCDALLERRVPDSRARTAALSLAALIFYVPANLFPVLRMEYLGRQTENTVWSGVVELFQDGVWFVATVVFVASILVPLLKLLGLFFLVWSVGSSAWQRERTWIYRTICRMGPWAMLDVFLVAILVALVRLGDYARIMPGPGISSFAAVVVLTLLASSSFDPRLIWQEKPS